jgi:hypothetical protein
MALISKPGRRSACWLAVGTVLAATISFSAVTAIARDDDRRDWRHDRDRDVHRDWHGGYYAAPPVVYGTPYYYPPPVVVSPGLGLSINIR